MYLNLDFYTLIRILAILGSILDIIGKVTIGYTAIAVHNRVWQEHKIDEAVFKEMKHERQVAFIAVVLMVVGFLMQLPGKLHL
ncbi:MAG: hypothetical protein R3B92_02705 [Patescibacteria group bacterium]|uniref:Uncharacterized protein n=1 Tax=candidate division WWE3 bacterium TaxID=2053526 RepID=A0A955EBM0_UNCKA|nr:hypothetical protein [candidate division WWE3 bacterium]